MAAVRAKRWQPRLLPWLAGLQLLLAGMGATNEVQLLPWRALAEEGFLPPPTDTPGTWQHCRLGGCLRANSSALEAGVVLAPCDAADGLQRYALRSATHELQAPPTSCASCSTSGRVVNRRGCLIEHKSQPSGDRV
jgi:hypothetical protein